ncbi:hypothetical protein HPB49_025877 [Dermacentor silvarum]|nr:hypothetical protein HPB49_025877 [Dermacentor silvarum]
MDYLTCCSELRNNLRNKNCCAQPRCVKVALKAGSNVCRKPDEPCSFIAPFYESTCQQRYSLHRLLALHPWNPEKSPQVTLFKFPAGCSCRVDASGDAAQPQSYKK